jgi:hypothetical protein
MYRMLRYTKWKIMEIEEGRTRQERQKEEKETQQLNSNT